MSQQEIEVILSRQLASCLALPIFIVDPQGTLLFYNEPAELVLGRHYEETGPMAAEEWATIFSPTDAWGKVIPVSELPLTAALRAGTPSHSDFWITGLDAVRRHIEVTAFPLIGQGNRHLGGIALFWESKV